MDYWSVTCFKPFGEEFESYSPKDWTYFCPWSLSRECMFLGSLSRHNKDLEQRTLKPSACHSSQVLDKPCYSSHSPLKTWEAQFFGNRGVEVFLATSCWTGTVRGIAPPPLASLKPQSPYSGVQGCVIFSMVGCSFIALLNWHCML